jgi:hypothetical protein
LETASLRNTFSVCLQRKVFIIGKNNSVRRYYCQALLWALSANSRNTPKGKMVSFAVNRPLCAGRFGNRRGGSTALKKPVGLSHSLPSVRGFWMDTRMGKENRPDELGIEDSGFPMELSAPTYLSPCSFEYSDLWEGPFPCLAEIVRASRMDAMPPGSVKRFVDNLEILNMPRQARLDAPGVLHHGISQNISLKWGIYLDI